MQKSNLCIRKLITIHTLLNKKYSIYNNYVKSNIYYKLKWVNYITQNISDNYIIQKINMQLQLCQPLIVFGQVCLEGINFYSKVLFDSSEDGKNMSSLYFVITHALV